MCEEAAGRRGRHRSAPTWVLASGVAVSAPSALSELQTGRVSPRGTYCVAAHCCLPCPGSPLFVSRALVGFFVCLTAALPLAHWAFCRHRRSLAFPAAQSGALVLCLGSQCLGLTSGRASFPSLFQSPPWAPPVALGEGEGVHTLEWPSDTDLGSGSSAALSLAVGPDGQVI